MYFCKHCGQPYQTEDAVLCVKCGAPKGEGVNYCHSCGNPITPGAAVCMTCGVPVNAVAGVDAKSKLVAGLLGIFLGGLGIHNFYLGYTTKAIIQVVCFVVGWVLTCIVIGPFIALGIQIWGLVEGILILCGKINVDGKGQALKD